MKMIYSTFTRTQSKYKCVQSESEYKAKNTIETGNIMARNINLKKTEDKFVSLWVLLIEISFNVPSNSGNGNTERMNLKKEKCKS